MPTGGIPVADSTASRSGGTRRARSTQEPSQETFWSFWKRYEAESLPRLTEKVQETYKGHGAAPADPVLRPAGIRLHPAVRRPEVDRMGPGPRRSLHYREG